MDERGLIRGGHERVWGTGGGGSAHELSAVKCLICPQHGVHSDSCRIPLLEEFSRLDMELCFKAKRSFSFALPICTWWL